MSRPFWLRPLRIAEKPSENVARAAAHNEPLEELLRVSAACLLESTHADRAGVWAEHRPGEPVWQGRVAHIEAMGGCAETCNANAFEVFPVEFNETQSPLEFFAPVFPVGPREFFDGISTAVGLPLKVGDRILGAVLAGSGRPGTLAGREALENIAAEIALALYANRVREEQEETNQKLSLRREIERLLASGATMDEALRTILSAAVCQTGAQFAGVARRLETSIRWELLAGLQPAEQFNQALFSLTTAVLGDRESLMRDLPGCPMPGFSVVGLPLDFSRDKPLVFLAGYRSRDWIPFEALEEFCGMVSNARAVSMGREADSAYRSLFESSSKALVEGAERRWQQTKGELRTVLDAVECGVVLVALDGRIRSVNARFGALFGLDQLTLQSLETFEDLAHVIASHFRVPESFSRPWKSFLAGSDDGAHDETELAIPTTRVLERYARPVLGEDGRKLGWLEVFWDVTAERQLQSKLQQAEKMVAVGQLASGIAHELSNPLTSIMGYAQLILREKSSRTRGEEARMIFEEAERARRIVKNLLSFARPAQAERMRADINEIIERTVALREYELRLRNIEIRLELETGLPATVGDPSQLQQVILNLLVNAQQAILEKGSEGLIVVRSKRVSAQRLSIEICDNGPGIPAEVSSRIFDLFFTTKASEAGTGLGLAIVRSIVERHGGHVAFENIPAGGAKFMVQLPLVSVPVLSAPLVKTETASPAEKHATAHILVVEDEPTVARLIQDVLEEDSHQVEAAQDSQDGLRRVWQGRYDLIICDLRMPGLDGPAFYDALVRAGNPARHRILFITGDTLGPHAIEFLQARQLPFLAKPFLVEELKAAVYRALEQTGATASASVASAEAHG